MRFEQKPLTKNYIAKNTELKTKSSTEFGKILLEKLNFSFHGKQIGKLRRRRENKKKKKKKKKIEFITSSENCDEKQSTISFRA